MGKLSVCGAGLVAVYLAMPMVPVQAQSVQKKIQNDETFSIASGDPAMADAVRRAQETLPEFLKILAKPPPATEFMSVKIGLREKGNSNTEFVWIAGLRQSGDVFKGTIGNRINLLKTYKGGDPIEFKQSDIVDWTYTDGTIMKGNYSSCVLFKRENSAEAEKVIKQLKLDCSWMGK